MKWFSKYPYLLFLPLVPLLCMLFYTKYCLEQIELEEFQLMPYIKKAALLTHLEKDYQQLRKATFNQENSLSILETFNSHLFCKAETEILQQALSFPELQVASQYLLNSLSSFCLQPHFMETYSQGGLFKEKIFQMHKKVAMDPEDLQFLWQTLKLQSKNNPFLLSHFHWEKPPTPFSSRFGLVQVSFIQREVLP